MKIFQIGMGPITPDFFERYNLMIVTGEAESPEDLYDWLSDGSYEAVVINLDMVEWGTSALHYLRRRKLTIPVIALLGENSETSWSEERADFLEQGGDDLIRTPASFRELAASLRTITRRGKNLVLGVVEFKNGDATVQVNLTTCRITINGREVILTGLSLSIFLVLASSNGSVLSREDISKRVYTVLDDEPESNVLHVIIGRIRTKLRDMHPDAAGILKTVYRHGYQMISTQISCPEQAA